MRRELRDQPLTGEAARWHSPQGNPASPTIHQGMVYFSRFPLLGNAAFAGEGGDGFVYLLDALRPLCWLDRMSRPLPKRLKPLGALLATLATGILLGRLNSSGEATGGESDGHVAFRSAGSSRTLPGEAAGLSPNDPTHSSRNASTPDPTSQGADHPTKLKAILAIPSQMERVRGLLALFDRMNKEELAATYDGLRLDPIAQMHTDELGLALQAWVDRDPLSALDYLVAKDDTVDWERETAVAAWAAKDPQAAIQWADQTPDAGTMNNWRIGAAMGAAATNPQMALDYLNRIAAETHPQSAKTARQATHALNPDNYARPQSFSEARRQ